MKTSSMYSEIGELESKRVFLIQKLQKLSDNELKHKPWDDKWSILEILAHIVLSEQLSIEYTLNKLSKPEKLKPVRFVSSLKAWLLKFVLFFNIKYKAPKITEPNSSEDLVLDELFEQWSLVRARLEELCKFSPELLKKGVFRHPYTGFMNFKQMLSFMDSHYNHHLAQIDSLYPKKRK